VLLLDGGFANPVAGPAATMMRLVKISTMLDTWKPASARVISAKLNAVTSG